MIRGIIFDCFGVLYRGSIAHLHELTPAHNRAELTNLSLSFDYGYVSHQDFLIQASVLAEKSPEEIQAIMDMDHVRNDILVDYIRELRPNYKIGLLSNVGRGVMDRLFSATEEGELFDTVVLSSEVGIVKPDAAIFTLASDRMGLSPENCLMVDDLAPNIESAISVGMQGVVFTTTNNFIRHMRSVMDA
ncbi:MAG: HAD-IA family hydrolase [Candidatus Saccharimonadales bacterium]